MASLPTADVSMMVAAKRPRGRQSKEKYYFGYRGQIEERAHRQQETDEAESTDRKKVGIIRLIADAHLAPIFALQIDVAQYVAKLSLTLRQEALANLQTSRSPIVHVEATLVGVG